MTTRVAESGAFKQKGDPMSLRPLSLFTGETLDADLSSLFENFTFEISDEISSDVVAERQAKALEAIESDALEMTFEAEPFDGVIGPIQRFEIDPETGTITSANGVTIDYDVDHAETVVEEIATALTELTANVEAPVIDSLLDLSNSDETVTRAEIGAAVEQAFEGEAFDGVIGTVQRFEIDPETGTVSFANGETVEYDVDRLDAAVDDIEAALIELTADVDTPVVDSLLDLLGSEEPVTREDIGAAIEEAVEAGEIDGDELRENLSALRPEMDLRQPVLDGVPLDGAAAEAFQANGTFFTFNEEGVQPIGDRLAEIGDAVQDGEIVFDGTPFDGSALGLIQVMDFDLIG